MTEEILPNPREETPMMFESDEEVTESSGGADFEEFFIPSAKDDLLADNDSCFTFPSPSSLEATREFIGDPANLEQNVKSYGVVYLSQNFHAVCSTTWHLRDMEPEFFQGIMNGVIAAVDLSTDRLPAALLRSGSYKKKFRSEFKVAFYIFCVYIEQLEKQVVKSSSAATQKKGGNKQHTEKWMIRLRNRALDSLRAVTHSKRKWASLWDNSKADREFVQLLMVTLSRYCEDGNITSQKQEVQRETDNVIQAFAHSIVVYQAGGKFVDIMLRLFHRHDACGHIAAEIVVQVHSLQKDQNEVIPEILRVLEENMDDIAQDNSVGKAYANMLNGFAKSIPVAVASCTEQIAELLKSDAYSVRSACISVITQAIIVDGKQAKEGSPRGAGKKVVENWWDIILKQSTDANAFVRTRVLHSITELAKENCVSRRKYRLIFEKVIERTGFGDKTQTVRKAGHQCLLALLELRPTVAESSLENLQLVLGERVDDLLKILPQTSAKHFSEAWVWPSHWTETQRKISQAVKSFSGDHRFDESVYNDIKSLNFDCVLKKVSLATEKGDGAAAFSYLLWGAKLHPGEKIVVDYHLQGLLGEYGTDVPGHQLLSVLDCVNVIWNMKSSSKERDANREVEALLSGYMSDKTSEIRAAATAVIMAQDDIIVRRCLTQFIPKWEKTLQMLIASDIIEIAAFLTTAERLGFKEAVHVLRRLPGFFCSETREIRDAALSSYRTFFMGEENDDVNKSGALLHKLMWELPFLSATTFETIRLLFKAENIRLIGKVAKQLVGIAVSTDDKEDIWRACLALSILPTSADKPICDQLNQLYQRCLKPDTYDVRLVCTFCDVLIKIGKSPLAKEDLSERLNKKLALDVLHPLLFALLDICVMSFTDSTGAGQTQMYGKVVEALFAVSEDPIKTLRILMYFTLMRLKVSRGFMNSASVDLEKRVRERVEADRMDTELEEVAMEVDDESDTKKQPTEMPLKGTHYVLYFGATVAFVFANWMEDLFSVNVESKENEGKEKKGPAEIDENEPDGPSEDDRGKAVVLQLRRTLFEANDESRGIGIPLISKQVVHLCHTSLSDSGHICALVSYMALIRLMLVSEHYCSVHIKYFLKMLQTTDSLELRKILLVGFSDIAVRFVNLVQPYTDIFTNQLHHADPSIRFHALMACVRLIVNDLVKVREQQCDIAMLICDPDERVSAVARGFFKEKVSKQNVMNLIPQLIARTDLYERLDESHVQQVFHYLIELVGKGTTESDSLTETFFGNLEAVRAENVWRISAYCLTLVGPQVSEKMIVQIREQIGSIKKSMADEASHDHVINALALIKKKLPEEKKRIADDLAKKVTAMNRESDNAQPGGREKRAGNRRSPQPSTSRAARFRPARNVQTSDSEWPSEEKEDSRKTRKGATKISKKKNVRRVVRDDSEDDSSDEESFRPRKSGTVKNRIDAKRRRSPSKGH